MSERNDGVTHELQQIEPGKTAFDHLYRNAFEVRRRLKLEPGTHVFDIEHPLYHRVQICANAFDNMYVVLQSKTDDVATSVRNTPYRLERWRSISKNDTNDLNYAATDSIYYPSRWRHDGSEHDSELDTADESYDFSEPLPLHITTLLDDMNVILPTLTAADYNEEESDEEFDEDRYNPVLQKELRELETALGTAGGALYLMQLAVLRRCRESNPTSGTVILPSGPNSIYTIEVNFDPEPQDNQEVWHPHVIAAQKGSLGSYLRTHDGKFEHMTTHLFTETRGFVSYEVTDTLERDGSIIPVDEFKTGFRPDEALPDDVLKLVKHLLKAITAARYVVVEYGT